MTTLHTVLFQKTVLASLIGLCLTQSVFALEEISDQALSQATGEGIAMLPENAYMIFQGAKETATTGADLLNRSLDTGYINYIPVGPLSTTAANTNNIPGIDAGDRAVGKADLFLYGLAVSASNSERSANNNERVGLTTDGSAINTINSWGTAENPWILKAITAHDVPNFATGTGCNGSSSTNCGAVSNGVGLYKGDVTYLTLEAPLYQPTVDGATNDAYNLKLGLWADVFVRNPYITTDDQNGTQFKYGTETGLIDSTSGVQGAGIQDGTRANRLRLQGIWNGFSLNGSNLKIFQTLNGATNTGGMSQFYNNTLGLSGIFRFNSGDAAGLLGTDTTGTSTKYQTTTNRYSTVYTGQANPTSGTYDPTSAAAKYRLRTVDTVYTTTGASWTAPTNLNDKVLRLSTRETTDTLNLTTPAINGGNAPTFDANEGVFIYNLNTNLVLGNLYQPVILGSDGKNFSLEIARIPNKESIYKEIYTNYDNSDPLTNGGYKGSTCNVYQCGENGFNATHSSISIGTVSSNDAGKTLQANKTGGAVGISFGKLQNNTISASTQYYYQLQKQERRKATGANRWDYLQADGSWRNGTTNCSGGVTSGECYNDFNTMGQWINIASFDAGACVANTTNANGCSNTSAIRNGTNYVDLGYAPNQSHIGYVVGSGLGKMGWGTDNGYRTDVNFPAGTRFTVPAWGGGGLTGGNPNSTAHTQAQINANILSMYGANGFYNGTTWNSNPDPTPQRAIGTTTLSANPMNNMGSAVIDGLLIQHMKITTTGL